MHSWRRQCRSGGRIEAAAECEMQSNAVDELDAPQLDHQGFSRKLVGLEL